MKQKIVVLMKKRVTKVIIIILVAFVLINIAEIIVISQTASRNKEWGLKLTAANVSSTGLVLTMERENSERSEKLLPCGDYWLEKRSLFGWKPLEPEEGKGIIVVGADKPLEDGGTETWNLNWENVFGRLPPGVYRISKEAAIDGKWEPSVEELLFHPELKEEIEEDPVVYATFVVLF